MQYDRQITISTGNSRKDIIWKQTQMTVSDLYTKLSTPIRGTETVQEYAHMSKAQQDSLKDVGGFVGGTLNGSRRKAINMTGRDIITLDFDNVPGWQTDSIIEKMDKLNCSYCIYSTRKHIPAKPRLRVVVPLDRTITPDEYEPCARRVAAHIGIDMADPTTFEACRLMYWPSCSADSDFVYKTKDAPFISADFLLGTYVNWHDYSSWPQAPGAVNYRSLANKQGDPTEKGGIVGAFCRTYDIYAAMDKFLPNTYEATDGDSDRFTYLGGSTTGGAVVYDDGKFLYSHHATDPCGGRLVNAFDLVRLHRYGDKDGDAVPDTPVAKLPSYKAMCDMALEDKQTVATINREQQEEIKKEFAGLGDPADTDANTEWAEPLKRTQGGKVQNTINNALIILDNDPRLKGKFALNAFAGRGEVLGALPWNQSSERRMWSDTDNSGLYWYLENAYELTGRGNIDSALDIHASQHAFNEVQDFIEGLEWDGVERLDTLFIDYLGAKDTSYNRAVCRKAFTAAIARAMQPGCKFDNMLILAGPQGIGKSTMLDKMSMGWFNDSIRTFEGKEASELLQGVWLVEVSELDAFRRTDVARIKQFLSLRADRYRAAYGRHVKELPRCCVFFGSTNTTDFLQDTTGNRRFWPVDVGEQPHSKTVWKDLTDDVITQLWAEAKARWEENEPLYLSGAVEAEALIKQEEHRDVSVREGLIEDFIEKLVPVDWQRWSIDRRRDYWAGATHATDGKQLEVVDRDRVTALEIWCELFNGNRKDIKQTDTREINAVLARLKGWKRTNSSVQCGPYGKQRAFEKQ